MVSIDHLNSRVELILSLDRVSALHYVDEHDHWPLQSLHQQLLAPLLHFSDDPPALSQDHGNLHLVLAVHLEVNPELSIQLWNPACDVDAERVR